MLAHDSNIRNPILTGEASFNAGKKDEETINRVKLIVQNLTQKFVDEMIDNTAEFYEVEPGDELMFGDKGYFVNRWKNGNMRRYWEGNLNPAVSV